MTGNLQPRRCPDPTATAADGSCRHRRSHGNSSRLYTYADSGTVADACAAAHSDDRAGTNHHTPSTCHDSTAPADTPEPTATAVPTPTHTPQPTATALPTPASVEDLDTPLPFDPAVVRGTLSNGLGYYIRHNEEPRDRAQITFVVKAGSVHETEEQRGLAHFVEHMAFNGTERFAKQEIISYLESIGSGLGADVNARTGFDDTLYFLEIPTDDPEITETAFQILSDWAYAVSFDPEEVELERGVVLEEWRLYQGFSSRLQDNLLRLLFGSSLYSLRSPIGLPEVIETAPAQLLRDYYEHWYRPDLMAVVAVGDFRRRGDRGQDQAALCAAAGWRKPPRRALPSPRPLTGRTSASPGTRSRVSKCSLTRSHPAHSSFSSAS